MKAGNNLSGMLGMTGGDNAANITLLGQYVAAQSISIPTAAAFIDRS